MDGGNAEGRTVKEVGRRDAVVISNDLRLAVQAAQVYGALSRHPELAAKFSKAARYHQLRVQTLLGMAG